MRSWENTELTPNQEYALLGPSPCDHCHQRDRCASEELACRDYLQWLESGKVKECDRKPTQRLFNKIFRAKK